MRYLQLFEQATVKLTDLYDERELADESEFLHQYIDDEDLRKDFVVHEMSPEEARTYTTARDDMPVYAAYRQFALKAQKDIVRSKMKNYDESRIIVTMNKTVLDGNHQLIAGILAKRPIRYINLAE